MKKQSAKLRIRFTKILGSTLALLSLSLPCFAMQFSQPVKLGSSFFGHFNTTGHEIEGATKINATKYFHPVKKAYMGYDKGYATFDGGKLYVHYEGGTQPLVRIGSSDKSNTVQIPCGSINKINTDQGITLYFLNGDGYGYPSYRLIGKRADGRFVKFVDGEAIDQAYGIKSAPYWYSFDTNKDSIIVHYRIGAKEIIKSIKLQWDEGAKWFSYAKI